jgi:hypothetical protein
MNTGINKHLYVVTSFKFSLLVLWGIYILVLRPKTTYFCKHNAEAGERRRKKEKRERNIQRDKQPYFILLF